MSDNSKNGANSGAAGDRRSHQKKNQNAAPNEEELESRQLNVQYKRYYVDVKQNSRGRVIKIAEMGKHYKSRLTLSMPAAVQLRDHITEMIKFSESVPEGGDNAAENGALKSENLVFDSRRYYIDLKENSRGRFLRIAQTMGHPRGRSEVAIPASGMEIIRNTLTEFIDKYSEGYMTPDQTEIDIKSKTINSDRKIFYLDVGHNERGTFVRVSEVKKASNFRTAINIPESALESFQSTLKEVIAEIAANKSEVSIGAEA